MLVHQCIDCGSLSINRIAADDDAETIFTIYQASLALDTQDLEPMEQAGIQILRDDDISIVRARLFGRRFFELRASPAKKERFGEF